MSRTTYDLCFPKSYPSLGMTPESCCIPREFSFGEGGANFDVPQGAVRIFLENPKDEFFWLPK